MSGQSWPFIGCKVFTGGSGNSTFIKPKPGVTLSRRDIELITGAGGTQASTDDRKWYIRAPGNVGGTDRETIRETARALYDEIENDDDTGGNISGGEDEDRADETLSAVDQREDRRDEQSKDQADEESEPPGGSLTRGHKASVSLNGTYSWVGDIRNNPQEVGLSDSDVALIVKRGGKPIGGDRTATVRWRFSDEDRARAVFDELERVESSEEESSED